MDFLIDCDDERQQIQVLQKLEKEGYRWCWSASGRPTEFVPISRIPDAKLIITKPKITTNSSVKILAYATGREKMKEKYKDSHKYVSGSEYLEYRERKVIL